MATATKRKKKKLKDQLKPVKNRSTRQKQAYRCEGMQVIYFSNMDFEDVEIKVVNYSDTRAAADLAAAFIESISQGCLCDAVGKRIAPIQGAIKRMKKNARECKKEDRRREEAGER